MIPSKRKITIIALAALLLSAATTVMVRRTATPIAVAEAPVAELAPAPANDDGRLGGPGNRPPDWRTALAQARSPEEAEQIKKIWCVDNLKQVGGAAREWAIAHDNIFPGDFFLLKTEISPRYLACPADTGRTEMTKWSLTTTTNISYLLISPSVQDTRPNLVVVQCPVHGHVALSDGSVLQGNIVAKRGIGPDHTLR